MRERCPIDEALIDNEGRVQEPLEISEEGMKRLASSRLPLVSSRFSRNFTRGNLHDLRRRPMYSKLCVDRAKGERKGDDRRGIEPIFHARIHLEGYDGRPGGRSVAFAFVGY